MNTIKNIKNLPTNISTSNIELFLSRNNFIKLSNDLYVTYLNNGGKISNKDFDKIVLFLIKDFLSKNNVNEYYTVESSATGYNNYMEVLNYINNDFRKYFYNYMRWNVYNPFKADVKLIDEEKKGYELMAKDHGQINLWQNEYTMSSNKNYRNNNKIPFYEAALYNRNYDKSNDGLTPSDRSSLETPIYGYNMRDIL